MALFDRDAVAGRVDYLLMRWCPVCLIESRDELGEIAGWLRQHGYHIVSVNASWLIESHMFRDLGSALGGLCHDQWQCLSEALSEAIAEAASAAGFALVLTGFDVFAQHQRDAAHELLEIVLEQAWRAAIAGRRVMCLAQGDNSVLRLRKLGIACHQWGGPERMALARYAPPAGEA